MSKRLSICPVVLIASLLFTLSATTRGQIVFGPAFHLPSGVSSPAPGLRGVASADLNGDGFADVVVSHSGANAIAVHLNDGSGGFLVPNTFIVGAGPRGIALADLDRDGHMDVAATNTADSTVSVMFGMGTGNFSAALTLSTGMDARRITAIDVNGDGFPDLVTPNNGSHDISVLMNQNGNGFANAVNDSLGTTPTGPRDVAGIDFNNDGSYDLAVANSSNGTVSLLTNMGSGTFALTGSMSTATSITNGIKVGDMENDGYLDLVVSSFLPPNLAVFLNDGAGQFLPSLITTSGTHLQGLDLGDFDLDGDLDVAICDIATNTTAVAANDGNGILTTAFTATSGNFPSDVIVADFDGDFKMDIATATFIVNDLVIFNNALPGPVLGPCGEGAPGMSVLAIDRNTGGTYHRVNAVRGSVVSFGVGQPATTTLARPFLIWGMVDAATTASVTDLPFGIGSVCLSPAHLSPTAPGLFVLANNFSFDPRAAIATTLTPWLDFILLPNVAFTVTFQGLILTGQGQVKTTNGIVLEVN